MSAEAEHPDLRRVGAHDRRRALALLYRAARPDRREVVLIEQRERKLVRALRGVQRHWDLNQPESDAAFPNRVSHSCCLQ